MARSKPLVAQMRLEIVVVAPQSFQFEMFSEHDRPRDQAEDAETNHDDFVDGVATIENFDDVRGGEDR